MPFIRPCCGAHSFLDLAGKSGWWHPTRGCQRHYGHASFANWPAIACMAIFLASIKWRSGQGWLGGASPVWANAACLKLQRHEDVSLNQRRAVGLT